MKPDQPETPVNYDQPVAYDSKGNPLYAHPPQDTGKFDDDMTVHISRAVDPQDPEPSPEAKARHDASVKLYPSLNLSATEYVIAAVRRHPIGLIIPLGVGTLLIALALSILANYSSFVDFFRLTGAAAQATTVAVPILFFVALVALGMFVVYYVYTSNKFYLTNESVIQEIQTSLFSKLEQTVNLSNIEDASYTQSNVLQYLFNYGSIRLSTEGDETTYRFTFVANPKANIATLNNMVEAFKNGRPVIND